MSTTPTPGYAGFARIFWMFLGPMILAMIAFTIASEGGRWLTATDATFGAVLGGILLSRWAEFHAGDPKTAEGEPATPAHLRKYVLVVSILGVAAWAAANVIGGLGAG